MLSKLACMGGRLKARGDRYEKAGETAIRQAKLYSQPCRRRFSPEACRLEPVASFWYSAYADFATDEMPTAKKY